MKNQLKIYFKSFILIFGISVLLWNCEKEENLEIPPNTIENKFKIQRILFDKLDADSDFSQISSSFKLEESIQKAKSSSFLKSSVQEDFTIDFFSTKKLTFENGVSYTFLIERANQETFTFENLVIEKKNDGSIRGYIIKYESDEYWNEGSDTPFKGKVSVSPYAENLNELIDKVNQKNITTQKSGDACGQMQFFTIFIEYSCTSEYHHGVGDGCKCGTTDHSCVPPRTESYNFQTYVPCNDFSDPIGVGDVGDGNDNGGGFGGDLGGGDDGSGSAILGSDGINVPNRDFLVDGLTYAPYASTYADYFTKSWQMFSFLETTNFVQYQKPENRPIYKGLKETALTAINNKYILDKNEFQMLYYKLKFVISLIDGVNFDFSTLPVEQRNDILRNSKFISIFNILKKKGVSFTQDQVYFLAENETVFNKIDSFLENNNSIEAKDWAKAQVILETDSEKVTLKYNPGKIDGRDDLEYTHRSDSDGIKTVYKLVDGSIVVQTVNPLKLNNDHQVVTSELLNDSYWYIKPPDTSEFYNFILPKTPNLVNELELMFKLGGKELATTFARYVLPVEDIKIIITGTNLDGQTESRWLAAGFLVVTVVPGSKAFKLVKFIPTDALKWGKVLVVNGKNTRYTFNIINDVVDFGSYGSTRFRAALGITDASKHAHHVLSRNLRTHRTIQKAAKFADNPFHIDELLNGISVASWRNQPNHPLYDDRVRDLLDNIPVSLSAEQTFNRLRIIIGDVSDVIRNNPNTHLNDLIF